jgi:cytochrome c biogenesis protein CcdA
MAVVFALLAAVAAALAAGSSGGEPARAVEAASATSADLLTRIGRSLPFGYAFAAGMVAAVNPCGFALLPAYLALYLGGSSAQQSSPSRSLRRALTVSATVTIAFVVLFGLIGLVLNVAAAALQGYLPYVGLAVGALLAVSGGAMLAGASLYGSLGERLADRLGALARRGDVVGYGAYGMAYALASLSCTLPIFLTVVGSALTVRGYGGALVQFVLYGIGMGVVLTVLTIAVALFKAAPVARGLRLLQHANRVGPVLLIVGGAYLVFYWLTLGGIVPGKS